MLRRAACSSPVGGLALERGAELGRAAPLERVVEVHAPGHVERVAVHMLFGADPGGEHTALWDVDAQVRLSKLDRLMDGAAFLWRPVAVEVDELLAEGHEGG